MHHTISKVKFSTKYIYYCWHNRCKSTELKTVSLIHKIHDNDNDGCTKAIKYLFTINNLPQFAQHVNTISKMNSVFITSEMSICVPQKFHNIIYLHTLKFSFPIQFICFLCGTWWYLISNTDTKGNHRTNTLNYSYTVSSILKSMLIALCNKIQILFTKRWKYKSYNAAVRLANFLFFKNHIHHVPMQIMTKRTLHTTGKTQICKFSCQQEED